MSIPTNITKAHLLKAADKIIKDGIPKGANSSTYDVHYKGQLLPPKLIISYANIFANNNELDRLSFEGGKNTPAFKLLEKNGFDIIEKNRIFPIIQRFLEQSKTDNLKTADYPKKYADLKMKISFGQGVKAKIPWISFLLEPNITSDGIYPVYLYYQEHNLLILAKGISETNKPLHSWYIDKEDTISSYFKQNELGTPDRYGSSYVYACYNTKSAINIDTLNNDINTLISEYKNTIELKNRIQIPADILKEFRIWFENNQHFDKEDAYIDSINYSALSSLSDQELIESAVQFKKEGGLVQTPDNRTLQSFNEFITANPESFKEFILAPFNKNFNLKDWIERIKTIKNFGTGTATIYLNRVDKKKYPILNNKVIDAYNILTDSNKKTKNYNLYMSIKELFSQLIHDYKEFDNYYQTDAFTQFIIGEPKGQELIQKWKGIMVQKTFDNTLFNQKLSQAGLHFNNNITSRFSASLLTKPFVLLTGLSGSGKTKLAQSFAEWMCQDESQYCIVPVGADWTNREPLLGYPNALKPDEYVKPDNCALDVIISANNHPALPHFLILDEMNLSHVERYFADFLSVMESKGEISLYTEGTVNNGVPDKLSLPDNLFIIGTVNIDETTYMFSPKVLDRANTIEFRVTTADIENFFTKHKEIDMSLLKTQGSAMAQSFLSLARNKKFPESSLTGVQHTLLEFFNQLKKTGAEFGYRTANEIIRLINQLQVIDSNLNMNEKLDFAIMQKLLPKLHGSRRKLCPVLKTLAEFCVESSKFKTIESDILMKEDFDFAQEGIKFPVSLEKIARMYKGATDNGFASYAEA